MTAQKHGANLPRHHQTMLPWQQDLLALPEDVGLGAGVPEQECSTMSSRDGGGVV